MTKASVNEFVTKAPVGLDWQRSLTIMTFTVVSVVAISILYWGQSIFIPVVLGAFFTFLLSPLVTALRQRGVPRIPAVFATVCVAAIGLGLVGWVVTAQISSLLRELPKYSENIKAKTRSLKQVAARSNGLTRILVDINQELGSGSTSEEPSGTETAKRPETGSDRLARVIIEPQSPEWLSRLSSFLAPVMEYLGELALAFVLVIFMLQKREELRNRLIRLAGRGQIVTATKFVDEAGQRISRFLLIQAIVNSTFGLILGLGLLFLGVKYALLWGFLAALLRYLPYIGPYLAAVFPITLSVAMFDGWTTTLLVAGLFVILELIVANMVEPRLYGQSMGVSEIALLISAAFWAFLWGPVGLVLSSPLTVCLVMLGRYIPQLEFLAVILGDEPALAPGVSFYQRLLARDQDEAEDLIHEQMETGLAEEVYDQMLIPALQATKVSRGRGDISEADEKFVLRAIREMVEDLGQSPETTDGAPEEAEGAATCNDAETPHPVRVLCYPAHDMEDLTAVEMLRNLLGSSQWDLDMLPPETLTTELLDEVAERQPTLLCLVATPPGGLAHSRYLCKRVRARFADLKILVCRWSRDGNSQANSRHLLGAGADFVTATLLETRQELGSQLPVLAQIQRDHDHGLRGRASAAGSGSAHRAKERRRATDRDAVGAAAST